MRSSESSGQCVPRIKFLHTIHYYLKCIRYAIPARRHCVVLLQPGPCTRPCSEQYTDIPVIQDLSNAH
jgi:hypothetical protein